jgi:hypothetical protein
MRNASPIKIAVNLILPDATASTLFPNKYGVAAPISCAHSIMPKLITKYFRNGLKKVKIC